MLNEETKECEKAGLLPYQTGLIAGGTALISIGIVGYAVFKKCFAGSQVGNVPG